MVVIMLNGFVDRLVAPGGGVLTFLGKLNDLGDCDGALFDALVRALEPLLPASASSSNSLAFNPVTALFIVGDCKLDRLNPIYVALMR